MAICVIVAVANHGVIGKGGTLPWHMSSDLRRFKKLTMGHAIVMGRCTYESIGRPLPGRINIVVTQRASIASPDRELWVAASLDGAVQQAAVSYADQGVDAPGARDLFIIGGSRLYSEAMQRAEKTFLTRIDAEVAGDTYFPIDQLDDWTLVEDAFHAKADGDDYDCRFQVYHRSVNVTQDR